MLSTLLQTLQGFLPKRFFIVSFGPVLVFALLNSVLLYFEDARFGNLARNYFIQQGTSGLDLKNAFFFLLAVLLLSFLYSMLTARLRSLLEGQWAWHVPGWLRRQYQKREALNQEYQSYRDQYDHVRNNRNGWLEALKAARGKEGKSACSYAADHPVSRGIHGLERKRKRGDIIELEELRTAFKGLIRVFEENLVDPIVNVPYSLPDGKRMNDDQELLDEVSKYAEARLADASIQKHNQLTVSFSPTQLAPTALGNIARSISSYARRRYGMDLDFMWTRLQKVMEGTSYYQTLMEAQI